MAAERELKENGGPMAALAALPRLLNGPLDDVRTIAKGMQVLPELARILATIETRVDHLDEEVVKMRKAVESMTGNVDELPERLDEVSRALHPLQRFGRRRGRDDAEPADAG